MPEEPDEPEPDALDSDEPEDPDEGACELGVEDELEELELPQPPASSATIRKVRAASRLVDLDLPLLITVPPLVRAPAARTPGRYLYAATPTRTFRGQRSFPQDTCRGGRRGAPGPGKALASLARICTN